MCFLGNKPVPLPSLTGNEWGCRGLIYWGLKRWPFPFAVQLHWAQSNSTIQNQPCGWSWVSEFSAYLQPSERDLYRARLNDGVCQMSLQISSPCSYTFSYTTSSQAMRRQNWAVSVRTLKKYFSLADSHFCRLQGNCLTFALTLVSLQYRWHRDFSLKPGWCLNVGEMDETYKSWSRRTLSCSLALACAHCTNH